MRASRAERFTHAAAAVPSWFSVTSRSRTRLRGIAKLASNSAAGDERILLDISLETTGVRVRETVPGTRFPARCPERHVEDDGWFCLGLSSGWMVEDAASASTWWAALEDFLKLQRVAARSGLWPDQNALSHGAAGKHHRDALALAGDVGLLDAYERHVSGERSVVAALDAALTKDGSRLINGRAACPCGRSRRGRPVLRRRCPHRAKVLALLREERSRARKLQEYWTWMAGTTCCGTMKGCPLIGPHAVVQVLS